MHNNQNRQLGVKHFKLGSSIGMKSMEPTVSLSRPYRSRGKLVVGVDEAWSA